MPDTTEAPSTAPAPAGPVAGPRVRLGGVGTAVPEQSYTQRELLDRFDIADPRVVSLFQHSAIERRHLVLPDRADGRESQGQLLRKHLTHGIEIGRAAVLECLDRNGLDIADVRHLCCVSSTGFLVPGFSALLIRELGLAVDCSRLDVVGMGCNAGLNALSAVSGWAAAHPGQAAVMVCIEVCSAAYVFDGSMRTSVVNSLFGDGAAAVALVAGPKRAGDGAAGPVILNYASRIIPEAIDAMRYDWDDDQHKFSFFLDPDVPYVVGAHVRHSVDRLLADTGLHRSRIAHWIIHSGGKKVIDSVRVNLGLTRHDVRHTIGVLRDYGNLSSGSFLFSFQRLQREGICAPGEYCVLMTMGPGSTIELALLRW